MYVLTEEQVFNRLHWTSKTDVLEDALTNKLSWWVPGILSVSDNNNAMTSICSEYYYRYIDLLVLNLTNFIDDLMRDDVSDPCWRVWHILNLHGDIVLEKGEDYRVLDWERRMSNGEWT